MRMNSLNFLPGLPLSGAPFPPVFTLIKRPAAAAVATAEGILPSIDWVNIDNVSAADVEVVLEAVVS